MVFITVALVGHYHSLLGRPSTLTSN